MISSNPFSFRYLRTICQSPLKINWHAFGYDKGILKYPKTTESCGQISSEGKIMEMWALRDAQVSVQLKYV